MFRPRILVPMIIELADYRSNCKEGCIYLRISKISQNLGKQQQNTHLFVSPNLELDLDFIIRFGSFPQIEISRQYKLWNVANS